MLSTAFGTGKGKANSILSPSLGGATPMHFSNYSGRNSLSKWDLLISDAKQLHSLLHLPNLPLFSLIFFFVVAILCLLISQIKMYYKLRLFEEDTQETA